MKTAIGPFLEKMEEIPQNPQWHGEGSVGRHTKLVCEALADDPVFRALPLRSQQELTLAALLHDIGKIPNTKLEEGQWVSPHHSTTGARMARELLWKEFGLCGSPEKQMYREAVCLLIRHHMVPGHILEQTDPEKRLLRMAADGELCPYFTIEKLCILAEADRRGRIAADEKEQLEKVALCREAAEAAGCLKGPGVFSDAYTQRAYFRGKKIWREQSLYDDSWGEVILLSGLPGTGKDTWIGERLSHFPVVSMDDIRREMHVQPTEEQGAVAQEARARAKKYLRAKQPFIWNATDLTELTRSKLISMMEDYGASVRIVYLETEWEENLRRNTARAYKVPESVIEEMLGRLVLPQRWEAQKVEWICL